MNDEDSLILNLILALPLEDQFGLILAVLAVVQLVSSVVPEVLLVAVLDFVPGRGRQQGFKGCGKDDKG